MDSTTLTPTASAAPDDDGRPAPPAVAPTTVPHAPQKAQRRMRRQPAPAQTSARSDATRSGSVAARHPRTLQGVAQPTHSAATKAPAKPSAIRRALALLLGSVLLVAVCVALLAAPLLALVAGVWAAVTEVRTIAAIWGLARHQDFGAVVERLATLDTASRVAFLAVSFFALLFALMLLMAGLLGRRWARLFIAPGLVFTAPTLVCYVVGWLWLTPVAARHGVSSLAQTSLAAYMLLDAVVLAAALCDMRPTLRRARRVARLGKRTRPSLPAVHIAGRAGLATGQVWRDPSAPDARANGASGPAHATGPDALIDVSEDDDEPRVYPPPRFALQAPITRPMAAVRIEDVAQRGVANQTEADRDEFADSAEAETWRIFSGEWAAWGTDDVALHQTVTLPALGWPATEDAEDVQGAEDVTTPAMRIVTHGAPHVQTSGAPAYAADAPTDEAHMDGAQVDDAQARIATNAPIVASGAPPTIVTPFMPTMPPTPSRMEEEPPAPALSAETELVTEAETEAEMASPVEIAAGPTTPLTDMAAFAALVTIAEPPELWDAPLTPDAPLAFAPAK